MRSIRARAPAASSALVRRVMQANASYDTGPEVLLRSALHRAGLRFRKNARPVPSFKCKADVVFPRARVCIFVDGCFWHGCPRHFHAPKTNGSWWREKVEDNRRRDRLKSRQLRSRGWKVFRIWEHEITDERIDHLVRKVVGAVQQRSVAAT